MQSSLAAKFDAAWTPVECAMRIYRARPHVPVKPCSSMASFVAELQSTDCKHNLATEQEPAEVTSFQQTRVAGRLSLCD